jgi:hypothetical protein
MSMLSGLPGAYFTFILGGFLRCSRLAVNSRNSDL